MSFSRRNFLLGAIALPIAAKAEVLYRAKSGKTWKHLEGK